MEDWTMRPNEPVKWHHLIITFTKLWTTATIFSAKGPDSIPALFVLRGPRCLNTLPCIRTDLEVA